MQDDQSAGSTDSQVKGAQTADSTPSELKLSGGSVPDPAQEALNAKQSEQPPSDPPSSPPASADTTSSEASSATEDNPASDTSSAPVSSAPDGSPSPQSDDTLDPIKKEALQKLEPLVSELDLNPEEKYRALMMIIQATDNKELINEAYQVADKIEDNKARAQALLGVINEIEYFKNRDKASN